MQIGYGTIMALVGLLVLLIYVFMPSLGGGGLSNRSVCAANLRGIQQSLNVYAADNNNHYPMVASQGGYALAGSSAGIASASAESTLFSMYNAHATPVASVTQNMWILVLTGQVAPKQFLCKSDPAPTVNAAAENSGKWFTNFNDGSRPSDFAYSYSFAYPWRESDGAIGDWWTNTADANLPLLADMAPLAGSGKPAATPGNPVTRDANSFNHQRDGQNVAFGDSHAEFERLPNVGQSNDNIYAASNGKPSPSGTAPMGTIPAIGDGGVSGAWDVCLVPAANGNSKYARK
jgi:hypothetical protein